MKCDMLFLVGLITGGKNGQLSFSIVGLVSFRRGVCESFWGSLPRGTQKSGHGESGRWVVFFPGHFDGSVPFSFYGGLF